MTKGDVDIAANLDPRFESPRDEKLRKQTLGNVRLMHHDSKGLILVPRPTSDPNDPLNW